MVRLIMGAKGSGKTKHLIEMINNAAKDEPGNVVCIEANRNMTYDIHYHIRLIDAEEYKLNSSDMQFAFSIYGSLRVGDTVTLICEKSTNSNDDATYVIVDYIED